jgi:hypothetical protein
MTGVGPRGTKVRSSNGLLSVITPLKRWGPASLQAQFALTKRFPRLKGLAPFKSVYFSQWSILTSIPYNGEPQPRERPRPAYLIWDVAFSAELDPYIESFILGIPRNINRLWESSYGYPGTKSVGHVRRYLEGFSVPIDHAYWAYPASTVRIILSGLEVAKEHDFLVEAAQSASPEEFARIYGGFLRRRRNDL